MDMLNKVIDLVPYEFRYLYEPVSTIYGNKEYMFYWKYGTWKIGEIDPNTRKVSDWVTVVQDDLMTFSQDLKIDLWMLEEHLQNIILNYTYNQHLKGNITYVDEVKRVLGEDVVSSHFTAWDDFAEAIKKAVNTVTKKPHLRVIK